MCPMQRTTNDETMLRLSMPLIIRKSGKLYKPFDDDNEATALAWSSPSLLCGLHIVSSGQTNDFMVLYVA